MLRHSSSSTSSLNGEMFAPICASLEKNNCDIKILWSVFEHYLFLPNFQGQQGDLKNRSRRDLQKRDQQKFVPSKLSSFRSSRKWRPVIGYENILNFEIFIRCHYWQSLFPNSIWVRKLSCKLQQSNANFPAQEFDDHRLADQLKCGKFSDFKTSSS